MPHTPDLYAPSLGAHALDNPVIPANNLTNAGVLTLRHNTPELRHILKYLDGLQDALPNSPCCLGIVPSDVTDDVSQVLSRQRRPD
jgi:hypothetical protein